MARRRSPTVLAAVLFTDIVGSSGLAAEMGDSRWKELLSRHNAIVRRELRRFHGRELDTAGDGFFASFERPGDAIRCACAASEAVRALGIELRAGVHVGECETSGGKLGGIGVHTAARIMGQAGAGEVWISGTTRDLVAGSGFAFTERGRQQLKGIPGEWTLFEVAAVDGQARTRPLDGPEARERRNEVQPAPIARRRLAVAAAAGVVAVALVVVLLLSVFGNGSSAASYPAGMVLVDAKSGQKRAFIPLSQIDPGFMLFAANRFWVATATPQSFVEIDPASGKVVKQFPSPLDFIRGRQSTYQPFAVAGRHLWVGSGDNVLDIDTSIGTTVDHLRLDELVGESGLTEGITLGGNLLWVSRDVGPGQVVGLDPSSGRVRYRFDNVPHHFDIAYGSGVLWAADQTGAGVLDPSTGTVTTVQGITETDEVIVAGAGFGWTSDPAKGVVYKINTSGQLVATYSVGLGASTLSFSANTVWVGSADGTVTGIDAITGAETTYRFGHSIGNQAAGGGLLLVSLSPGPTPDGLIAGLPGKVVKLFSEQGAWGQGDEAALNWNVAAFQIDYATCAKLLNYPDLEGAAGARLRPEIAAAMPKLSNGGRTYTFLVRKGYRFSPPSNQSVTAETFRHSIERALSPKLGDFQPAAYLVRDIEGEQAFESGQAGHISGLRVNGDQLSITLTAPSPDFLDRLALPFFCPVPRGTPLVRGAPVVGGAPGGGGVIPSAGPYYISDYNNENYIILKRNPNYEGSRPHDLDEIALREAVDAGTAIGLVQHQGWDGIVSSGHNTGSPITLDPALEPDSTAAAEYGKAPSGGYRYFAVPLASTDFIALNSSRGPFRARSVRLAAAYALDRPTLAAIFGEAPAEQLLPATYPGYSSASPFPLHADPARARALLHGRHPNVVMANSKGCGSCAQLAETVRAELSHAGFRVTVKSYDDVNSVFSSGAKIDLIPGLAHTDFPDSATFLEVMLEQASPPGWISPGVLSRLRPLDRLSGARRQSAAGTLATQLAARELPVIPYAAAVQGEFFAPSVGCKIFPPMGFGVDLAALCVKR